MASPWCKCEVSSAAHLNFRVASCSFLPLVLSPTPPAVIPLSLSSLSSCSSCSCSYSARLPSLHSPPNPIFPTTCLSITFGSFALRTDIPLSFLNELNEHAPKRSASFSLLSKAGSACGDVFIEFELRADGFARASEPITTAQRIASRSASVGVNNAGGSPLNRSMSVNPGTPHRGRSSSTTQQVGQQPPRNRSGSTATTAVSAAGRSRTLTLQRGDVTEPAAARSRGMVQAMQTLADELPMGWQMRVTPSGRTYYANHTTRATQWDRPVAPMSPPEVFSADGFASPPSTPQEDREQYSRRSLLAQQLHGIDDDGFGFPQSPSSPMTPDRSNSGPHDGVASPGPGSASSARNARFSGFGASGLRGGQQALLAGFSQNDRLPTSPTELQRAARRGESAPGSQPRVLVLDPPPATRRRASSNSATGTRSGESLGPPPRGAAGPATPEQRPTGDRLPAASPYNRHWDEYVIEEDVDEFPIGWEMRHTTAGRPYYVDHINRATTFEDPRVKHREDRIKEAIAHDAALPQYKRDLRRKLLRLRDLFVHQARQVRVARRPGPPRLCPCGGSKPCLDGHGNVFLLAQRWLTFPHAPHASHGRSTKRR